jgi:hypothetical protein
VVVRDGDPALGRGLEPVAHEDGVAVIDHELVLQGDADGDRAAGECFGRSVPSTAGPGERTRILTVRLLLISRMISETTLFV